MPLCGAERPTRTQCIVVFVLSESLARVARPPRSSELVPAGPAPQHPHANALVQRAGGARREAALEAPRTGRSP